MSLSPNNVKDVTKKLVKKAVELLLKAPFMKVPMAMRAVNFSPEDSKDPAKQMAVRRALDKEKEKSVELIDDGNEGADGDGTKDGAAANATTVVHSKPKLLQGRMNSKGMHRERVNKKLKKNHEDQALMRATKLYAEEQAKGKGNGMSAEKVSEQVKIEFDGVAPPARTIRRYVNEYKLVGAPLEIEQDCV